MNRISQEKVLLIYELLTAGLSIRSVCEKVGVAKNTVLRIRARLFTGHEKQRSRVIGLSNCDQCGTKISKDKEFFRRTRRTRHKFCSSDCYQAFFKAMRRKRKPLLELEDIVRKLRETIHDREYCGPAKDAH